MALSLENLLAPISEEAPAGPDLAYDLERSEIEQAFDSSASGDGGPSGGPETDWRRITNLIESQSAKTKDVWLPVYLCRAGAKSGQLEIVTLGAQYLAGLLESFWDTVHPQLDEYGFQGRKGPCDSLTRIGEFLGPLQRVALLEHPRLGRFSGIDFERFRGNGEAEDGYGMFRAALSDVGDEPLQAAAEKIDAITAALKQTDAILTSKAEGDTAPNFQPVYDALSQIKRAVLSFVTAPAEPEPEAEADGDAAPATGAAGPRIAGRVDSREDVIRVLDAIADYYRRQEPASPVPILLQRAREWVTSDFLKVLEDIAPTGLEEARRVLVSRTNGS
jgi:type VI secretion system protein ImpA